MSARRIVWKREGQTYESTYGGFMAMLKECCEVPGTHVIGPPLTWLPFLLYAGATWQDATAHFDEDRLLTVPMVDGMIARSLEGRRALRTLVEAFSAMRPELVDALWKYDQQWDVVQRNDIDFAPIELVTNNGGFHRPRITDFVGRVRRYRPHPNVRRAIIVPCAADKPYPAPLHRAVMAMLPDESWHVLVASGVVGIAPQDLWGELPNYDSGLPNEWRLLHEARDYFGRIQYDRVVVYADYYNRTIVEALMATSVLTGPAITVVNPIAFYADYLNLLDPVRLARLAEAIKGEA